MKEILDKFPSGLTIYYFTTALLFALIVRFILCIFKSLAHYNGETINENDQFDKKLIDVRKKSRMFYFKKSFLGFNGEYKIDDYWLPYIIGSFELILFPLLYDNDQMKILGGWLAFKAIVNWATRNSRTAYNRFLLGNMLVLLFSFIMYKCFIV